MRWLWVSVFFTAVYWIRTVHIFTAPSHRWVWLVIAAIAAAGLGLRRVSVEAVDRRWLVLLVPLAIAVWWVPFPFHLPALLIGLALLFLASARFSPTLAWVGLPLGAVGLVLAVQAAVFPLVYIFSARVHEIPSLTPLFYALAKPFNPRVSLSEHQLIIHYVYDVFGFPTRLEALGFIPLALMAAGGLTLLAAARRPARILVGFLAFLIGYSILRYLFLVFLAVKFKTAGMFWLPVPLALGFVPLTIGLAALPVFNRSWGEAAIRLRWPGGRPVAAAAGLVIAAVVGVVGLFAYHDPGTPKQGRILIEELHSDWEWTTQKYDTEWYGRKSGYNYYNLAQYLDQHYHVDSKADSLLPDLLAQYDIVMLKTPTSPYSEREIDALVEFVRRGGGLWLHGDHTNVFGTSTYLNRLSEHFGLRFRYDSTYDLRTMALSLFERPPVFPHPTVNYMPPYLFATSCTMEAPFFSENMILGYGLKTMYLDYSQGSFFPKKENRSYSYGVFVQQGGVKYGRGRVAGYTDSTCFSNFFMFIAGKPELALGTVEWLNRANRFSWLNPVLFALGIAAALGGAAALRRWERPQQAVLVLCAGFLGFALAVMIYDSHVRRAYRPPQPRKDYTHVAFESEHSRVTLPTRGLTKNPEISLHTFYVWTQRLGFFPSFEPTLEEALEKGDLVVVADPWKPFTQEEIDRMVLYVSNGGRLLILIDPRNRMRARDELLGSLGIRLVLEADSPEGAQSAPAAASTTGGEAADEERLDIVSLEGDLIVPAARAAGLAGGTPRLRLSDGRAILVESEIGAGRVFVFADFFLFTDQTMGHTGETPDPRKRRISELEYWMLREIMGLPQPDLLWKPSVGMTLDAETAQAG